MQNLKRALSMTSRFVIPIVAIWLLVSSDTLRVADLAIRPGGYTWLLAGILCGLAAFLLGFFRFWTLMRASALDIDLVSTLRVGFLGAAMGLVSGVGGDVVKIVYVAQRTGQHVRATVCTVVDRAIGLSGLLVLTVAALLAGAEFIPSHSSLVRLTVGLVAVLTGVAVVGATTVVSVVRGRASALVLLFLVAVFLAAVGGTGLPRSLDETGRAPALGHLRASAAVVTTCSLVCLLVAPSLRTGRTLNRWFSRRGWLGHGVLSMVEHALFLRDRPATVVGAAGMAVCGHLVSFVGLFCLAQALTLQSPPSLGVIFMAAPPALIANTLFIPGGGIGVGEVAFDRMIAAFSATSGPHGGAAIFLLLRVVTLFETLLPLPFLVMRKEHRSLVRVTTAEA